MGDLTWFRSGGLARFYLAPSSEEELIEAVKWAQREEVPFHLMGLGANSLFPDDGYPGLILHMYKFRQRGDFYRNCSPSVVEADAGASVKVVGGAGREMLEQRVGAANAAAAALQNRLSLLERAHDGLRPGHRGGRSGQSEGRCRRHPNGRRSSAQMRART